ncbi:MAG: VCBS repeat-containing protein [Planctomycetaceae bacterium]|nr:VCBS repeat-containing protein [Planctomycetaceae bacterium]
MPRSRAECPIVLIDVTARTGITFQHTDGSGGHHYIVETFASGLATFDYDGDGATDIYFLNGRPLRGTPNAGRVHNALYRNLGGMCFQDVTPMAGVGDAGYGLGVAVGDYDNDGHPDLYVSNFGPNVLYHNNADGTFSDVTPRAGVERGDTIGAGVNFVDIDGNGHLDLFVGNYAAFSYDNHVTKLARGIRWYGGPVDYPPQPNRLFRSNGDGTFLDVSERSGIQAWAGAGMGTLCLDYDDDGDTDIFVCNDEALNFLFQNDGHGQFRENGLLAGVACNLMGRHVGNMGADCGDYDLDGYPDLFVTNFRGEKPILFRNLGGGLFEDVTMETGAAAASTAHIKWGCGLVDFDNDGYKDIFIGCGHFSDELDFTSDGTAYRVVPIILRNGGDGRFVNVTGIAGAGSRVKLVARGVVFDDLDNDGRVDVVVQNSRHAPTVLRNESPTGNHWLQIRLIGRRSARDAVGTRVRVTAGGLTQVAEDIAAAATRATTAHACISGSAPAHWWNVSRSTGWGGGRTWWKTSRPISASPSVKVVTADSAGPLHNGLLSAGASPFCFAVKNSGLASERHRQVQPCCGNAPMSCRGSEYADGVTLHSPGSPRFAAHPG